MSDDFFDKPFNEETHQKLRLFSDYLEQWLPVFLKDTPKYVRAINIFDFFAGAGADSEGTYGSPLLILDHLRKFNAFVCETDVPIRVHFNDMNKVYCERLAKNIRKIDFNQDKIKLEITNSEFREAFDFSKAKFSNSANLIFLDQFGVKCVDKELFQQLVQLKMTDVIFFVSSSIFGRFSEHDKIQPILELQTEKIKNSPATKIHRLVAEQYQSFIPMHVRYFIAPFSIKKGPNIYGLIFGSSHPLGLEKFLDICWKIDEQRGEANFDIDGENIDADAPSLFAEMNTPSKIQVFENELRSKILSKELKTDREIFFFAIKNGFTNKHIEPVIEKLRLEKKIALKHPSFRCKTVCLEKDREPKKVEVLS